MKMLHKRMFVTAMLVVPIAVLSVFFIYMVRESNARHAAKEAAMANSKLLALPAMVMVNGVPLDSSGTGAPPALSPSPAPLATGATMVRPESLQQGYIIIVKDLAGLASPASPIHLASSFNGWDPSDVKQKLSARSDLRWQIIMPKAQADSGIAFKFTRGNWDREELRPDLTVPDNRSLPMIDASKLKPGEQPIFEFEVPKWGDQRPASGTRPDLDPYHDIVSKATIRRLQVTGGGVEVPVARDLLVLLPKGYDAPENRSRTYRVLYMMDGQNLFEPLPNLPAEWGIDEAMQELDDFALADPLIVVGIPHAGKGRSSEYLPLALVEGAEPRAKQFVQFLTGEVMPRVERTFRVKVGPEFTAIGGSSLGAVVAMYAACEKPELFGKVLAESMSGLSAGAGGTSATGGHAKSLEFFSKYATFPGEIYLGMGAAEMGTDADAKNQDGNAALVTGVQALAALIKQKNPAAKVMLRIGENDTHSETAWAKRFPEAIKFLFPRHTHD